MYVVSRRAVRQPQQTAGFTLAEVVVAIAVATLSFGGVIYGYVLTADRAQWSAYSLAAQSLAMQGVEQARAAKWDPKAWPAVDELGVTNYTQVDMLDVPVSGQPVRATNYISVTAVSQDPPLRQLRADCVWSLRQRPEKPGALYQHRRYPPHRRSMKLPLPIRSASRRSPTGRSAFTLAEIMTAMGLFSLVVIGVVYSQLFGMRTVQHHLDPAERQRQCPQGAQPRPGRCSLRQAPLCRQRQQHRLHAHRAQRPPPGQRAPDSSHHRYQRLHPLLPGHGDPDA